MKTVHLVICDLFPPEDFAAEARAGLRLPALEKMLARGRTEILAAAPLENWLCGLFGVPCRPDAPVAPVSAAFDGLGGGCWLRADPVHLRLQHDRLVLLPEVGVGAGEAGQLCAALNEHFSGRGMEFFAPHPQRWYLRVAGLPDIGVAPLSRVAGRDVRDLLPAGKEAAHWRRVLNEIQMLLFSHPVNGAREVRGELPVNSLWLWGGGCAGDAPPQKTCDRVSSDETLPEMFAAAAGVPFSGWSEAWHDGGGGGQLLVWTGLRPALLRGDPGAWRTALQAFETGYAQPLWRALRVGKVARLRVDVLGADRTRRSLSTRADTFAFWRRAGPFAERVRGGGEHA